MAYIALYRQWRPQTFADIVGQEHVSMTLSRAIEAGRIAHAYLFAGPRGTGKTSTAKILAKALNCEHGPTANPCNECANCKKINTNSSMDVYEIDAASNRGIDEIRDLRETVKFAPVDGKYKVYIIDEVHMLTMEAFNALLKTLEEPPSHVVFILATTEAYKVPATIQSRCQRYDFKRITKAAIEQQLAKIATAMQVDCEAAALALLAERADGGMRDALSLMDQCMAMARESGLTAAIVSDVLGIVGQATLSKLTAAIIAKDVGVILTTIEEIVLSGKAVQQFFNELLEYWRQLLLAKAAPQLLSEQPPAQKEQMLAQAAAFSHAQLLAMAHEVNVASQQIRFGAEPRLVAEMALLKLLEEPQLQAATPAPTLATALQEKVQALERVVRQLQQAKPAAVQAAAPPPPQAISRTSGQAAAPAASQLPETAPSPAAAAPQLVSTGEAADLWQKVLVALKEQKKASLLACIMKVQPLTLKNNQLQLAFQAPFLKARTEREDYRQMIEAALQQVAGQPLTIKCVLADGVAAAAESAAPPAPKKKMTQPAMQELDAAGRQCLQNAMDVFGGQIVAAEDDLH